MSLEEYSPDDDVSYEDAHDPHVSIMQWFANTDIHKLNSEAKLFLGEMVRLQTSQRHVLQCRGWVCHFWRKFSRLCTYVHFKRPYSKRPRAVCLHQLLLGMHVSYFHNHIKGNILPKFWIISPLASQKLGISGSVGSAC